jgi:two-component system chemotaxis response regulator CheY
MAAKILVVDDALSVRQLAKSTLESEGFEVIEALDGKDAVMKLATNRFELIITDINMPNMGGMDLLALVKNDRLHKFTPVLIMTTERSEARKEEARNIGARAWLTKPFIPSRLLDAVQKLVVAR